MKKILAVLIAALTLLNVSYAVFAEEFKLSDKTFLYVSTDGNDKNDGSFDSPFATLEAARDKIRSLKKESALGKDGATVYVRGGKYSITESFTLTSEDSGTAEAPITYSAYKDEDVVFLGGISIPYSSFKKSTNTGILNKIITEEARSHIMELDLNKIGYKGGVPKGTLRTYQGMPTPEPTLYEPFTLYIGEDKMHIARYPNETTMKITEVVYKAQAWSYWLPTNVTSSEYVPEEKRDSTDGNIIKTDDSRIFKWNNEGLIYGTIGVGYLQNYAYYTADETTGEIRFNHPVQNSGIQAGYTFYGLNLIYELDAPGEYWVSDDKILYCYLPENANTQDIIMTTNTNALISCEGADYVNIKGISLEHSKGYGASIKAGNYVRFSDCRVVNNNSIWVGADAKNSGYANCYIYSGATACLNGGDLNTLTSGNNYIVNSELTGPSTLDSGIWYNGVGNRIAYNEISGCMRMAICGANLAKCVIEFNDLHDNLQYVSDQGVIYIGAKRVTDWGNKVMYNYIHDNKNKMETGSEAIAGIYLDDTTSGTLCVGNVIEGIRGWGFHLGGTRNTILYNNIMIDCKSGVLFDDRHTWEQIWKEGGYFDQALRSVPYRSDIWKEEFPELYNILEDEPTYALYTQSVGNIKVNTGADKVHYSFKDLVNEGHFEYKTDPGFYDMENKNYMLKEDSEPIKNGFKQIPFTRMGRLNDRAYKRTADSVVMLKNSPYAIVNGEKISIDPENDAITPVEFGGKVYVPLRVAAEGLGAEVVWNEETAHVELKTADKVAVLSDDGKTAIINGVETELIVPTEVCEGRTYITAETLAELLGYNVYVDESGIVSVSGGEILNPEADRDLIEFLRDELL